MSSTLQFEDSRRFSTSLRGIAILCILINHCLGCFTRYVNPLGGIGVTLFLILSGYGLNMSFLRTGGGYI